MKKLPLLLFAMIIALTSCSKDATDVDFSTDLSKTSDEIVVNDTPVRVVGNGDFSTQFILSLENDDTRAYLDKLKDLSLKDVRLKFQGISALSGNQTPTQLKITFNNRVEIILNDFVYDRVADGQEFALNQTQQINEMAQILLNNKQVTIKIEGHIPDVNTYRFFIKFLAKANITASTL